MLYEYRIYECHPGKRDAWVEYMENVIIPFQVSKGMVVAGSFIDEEDDNCYVWMRRFDDEADREALYEAVYQSDGWTNEIAPRIPDMLNRETIKVQRLVPTPKSVIN
jgi:hypothetical protein